MTFLIVTILTILSFNISQAEELRWDLMHQSDYKVVMHHVEVDWVNKSYMEVEKFELVKYNRSQPRTLNISATVFKEIGKDLLFHVQLYKFISNTYKYFPMGVLVNFCKEWKRNSFKLQDVFAQYSNIKPCPLKPGYIHTTYLNVNDSTLPPFMPTGSYKLSIKLFNMDEKFLEFALFGDAVVIKKYK